MWSLPGMLVSIAATLAIRNHFSMFVFGLWLLTAVFGSAEAWGLFRELKAASFGGKSDEEEEPGEPAAKIYRVVTINCDGGSVRAASEAGDLDPDLVFLQEAPSKRDVEELTRRLYANQGSFVLAGSLAILGRGEFVTFVPEEQSHGVHSRFRHRNGTLLDLTNLKLDRSIPRWEVWKAEVRQEMKESRVRNRKAVRGFVNGYNVHARQPVRIVAGDFATPPGDDIFRPLKKAGLRDAFVSSGQGIGNTFPSDIPILRLNQIWISPEANLIKTTTKRSFNSDHRFVICEFILE